jgi:dihydrolipoamide dehydrogenase
MANTYDVAVIGSGPGGYVAAIRASQLGLKVAIVERESLGGVCLNWGCIPTKALLKNATVLQTIRKADFFGIAVEGVKADYGKAVERSQGVVAKQTAGIGYLMKKNKIDVLKGQGTVLGPGAFAVDGVRHEAKHVIVATGATPRVPEGLVADGKTVFTAREGVAMSDLPERMLILGGGAIGCEFAYVFASYGCKVTLIEAAEHLLPREEPEIAAVLEKAYGKLGIEVLSKHRVTKATQSASGVSLEVEAPDGSKRTLEAPRLLVGIGASPNVQGLGLEHAGVRLERGAISTDGVGRTNVPGIWAIGDVTGKAMLAHVASAMAVACVETIADHETEPVNFDRIPSCTYCEPQVASIGLTEAEARKRGHEIKIGTFPFAPNGKAQAMGTTEGLVKVVIEAKHGEILGAHMIGPEVTELIAEIGLGMNLETTALEVDRTIHAHPTLSEVVKEAALAAIGHPIHL